MSYSRTTDITSNGQLPPSKPKLVFVTTVGLTLKSFFHGQIPYLKRQGFEIIAVSSGGQDLEDFAQEAQVSTHAITMTRGISPLADFIAVVRLWMLFLKIRPAIIHCHTPKAGVLGMFAATFANVPVKFYTLHGIMMEIRSGWTRTLLKVLERTTCALADEVLAVSHSVMDVVVSEGLCPQRKVKVLAHGTCNGIDAVYRFNPSHLNNHNKVDLRSKFGLDETTIVIGFVGRLVKDKGVAELASAWKLIKNEYSNSRMLMIGPVEAHNPVPDYILEELAGDDRVIMVDSVANEKMPPYYGIMDIVALPSYREGCPYVVLEASAMRLPVVATRVTGCIDAVTDGVTGILVSPKNIQELVRAIRLYIEDPVLRLTHGKAGRERVLTHFKQEPIWEALSKEYSLSMSRKGLSISSHRCQPESQSPLSEKGQMS